MLTCTPPIRFESVSWKPSEMAMPPIPSAAIAAETSIPKQLDSTTLTPTAHTAMRAILTKMLDEGSGELSCESTRRSTFVTARATSAVKASAIATVSAVESHSTWTTLWMMP